jgi:hypothetical protein
MKQKLIILLTLCLSYRSIAQQSVSFNDLSFWKATNKSNWQIVGDVSADLTKPDAMTSTLGKGILVNIPNTENRSNLVSVAEYGDVDVSFDFMMAAHSNSGFYLQGRYEVQLFDSWGVKQPAYSDCGGIYKRRKFIPQEYLYEGHAPRTNACLAPGLWQHLEISFQAPKFDAAGNKTSNAKILVAKLNGVIIHENLELTGPTGGAISETEAPFGPFLIQGDHGAVAFKNMQITNFNGQAIQMSQVNYQVFYGKFNATSDFSSKKPEHTGSADKLTWEGSRKTNDFGQILDATLTIPTAGKHTFDLQIDGKYLVKVNGKELLPEAPSGESDHRFASVDLPAGQVPISIVFYKYEGWAEPVLGLWIQGPASRATAFHRLSSVLTVPPANPILMDATTSIVFRSFNDLYENEKHLKRIVHAVNVGNPAKLHYTYDLDNGAIAQIWKGDFLDVSPMWDSRGDGSSSPRGAVLALSDTPVLVSANDKALFSDTPSEAANFRTLGYDVDDQNLPTFNYRINGNEVEDQIRIQDEKYFLRTLSIKNVASNQVVRLAIGKSIEKVADDLYSVDDKHYYIRATGATIEQLDGKSVLTVPASTKVQYAIVW